MSDIFISYSSTDVDKARTLAKVLITRGWSVWWDRKIPPGKIFSQVIKEALDNAKCVVVLWSKNSISSEWVQNEAAEGVRRKILVPVFVEEVDLPFEFKRIQAARLVDWDPTSFSEEFEALIRSIETITGSHKADIYPNRPQSIEHESQVYYSTPLKFNKPTSSTKQLNSLEPTKDGIADRIGWAVIYSIFGSLYVLLFVHGMDTEMLIGIPIMLGFIPGLISGFTLGRPDRASLISMSSCVAITTIFFLLVLKGDPEVVEAGGSMGWGLGSIVASIVGSIYRKSLLKKSRMGKNF